MSPCQHPSPIPTSQFYAPNLNVLKTSIDARSEPPPRPSMASPPCGQKVVSHQGNSQQQCQNDPEEDAGGNAMYGASTVRTPFFRAWSEHCDSNKRLPVFVGLPERLVSSGIRYMDELERRKNEQVPSKSLDVSSSLPVPKTWLPNLLQNSNRRLTVSVGLPERLYRRVYNI